MCLPPQLHPEVALAALEKGKHVFIEKPLALTLTDCDQLIDAAKRDPSRKVTVGFNLRSHRLVRQAWNIINRGELGAIKRVCTLFTGAKHSGSSAWRNSPGTGGAVLFDLGVHHFDLVRFLLQSEVEEVTASTTMSGDGATVSLSMCNGAQVRCDFAHGTPPNQSFEIHGERGSLRVRLYRSDGLERFHVGENPGAIGARLRAATSAIANLPRTLRQSSTGGEYAVSYVEQWNQFADAILRDKPVTADLLAGRRALEIVLAASHIK